MKLILPILALLLCGGCGNARALPCVSGKVHEWSKWADKTNVISDLGYQLQYRYCTNCNLINREYHK